MRKPLSIIVVVIFLDGCSREYAPDSSASGEQIYQAACLECHKPAANGSIYTLKAKNANAAYIAEKVHGGSLLMPSFPNLKSDDLTKISIYALEHSAIAEE